MELKRKIINHWNQTNFFDKKDPKNTKFTLIDTSVIPRREPLKTPIPYKMSNLDFTAPTSVRPTCSSSDAKTSGMLTAEQFNTLGYLRVFRRCRPTISFQAAANT
jgi:hypothetical protein